MSSKKFRLQKDALKTINISMALFLKLLTKTCEVVQTTSVSTAGPKRVANTLDVEHLAKAVKRYEVLTFMKDLVGEMTVKSREARELASVDQVLADADASLGKRKERIETPDVELLDDSEGVKKHRNSQASITSFFKPNN